MNKRKSRILISTILLTAIMTMSAIVYAQTSILHVEGSSTVLPVTSAAEASFEAAFPSIDIQPLGGGSGAGFERLAAGTIEIGAHSKEPGGDWATAGLEDMRIWAIGIDSLAIIVHTDKASLIEKVTPQLVSDIFCGVYNNWQELNGVEGITGMPNEDIGRIIRPLDSGTHACFKDNFLKPMGRSDSNLAADCETETDNIDVYNRMKDTVTGGEKYIAYIGRGFLDLGQIHDLWIWSDSEGDWIEPTKENSESGAYPISRWLWYSTKGTMTAEKKRFISYVMSHPALLLGEGYMNKWRCDFCGRASGDTTAPLHPTIPDAKVDGQDLGYWLGAYVGYWGSGLQDPYADIDYDCDVDGTDLGIFLNNYIQYWSGGSPPGYP